MSVEMVLGETGEDRHLRHEGRAGLELKARDLAHDDISVLGRERSECRSGMDVSREHGTLTSDAEQAETNELRERIDSLDLPEEVEKAARRELSRLERLVDD